MTRTSVDRIASALLYEGYMLYPYRRSAVKNWQRFNFGVIYPEAHSRAEEGRDPCEMRTECLVRGGADATVDVTVRFLHLFARAPERPGEPEWHEAVERDLTLRSTLGELLAAPRALRFVLHPGEQPGRQVAISGQVDLSADLVAPDVSRVRVTIANRTPMAADGAPTRDEVLLRSLVSAHTILRTAGGDFISLIDPPESLKARAEACRNVGTWPVLAGEDGARDTMLSSPIIVYDFPTIAPESPGDFFDGTEMDEMLSLRILTLTDEEKREMRESDERARRILQRTESMAAEQMMQLHGAMRRPEPEQRL